MRLKTTEAQGFRLLQIIRLDEEGVSRKQIASLTDCSQAWVSKVLKRCRQQGKENVRPKGPPPGHRPALGEEQLNELASILKGEALAYGFDSDGWSQKRIARVIEERYGVHHDPSHISRLLKKIGFTRQKPRVRDYRRDEAQVAQWKTQDLPALKKKPSRNTTASSTPMRPRCR